MPGEYIVGTRYLRRIIVQHFLNKYTIRTAEKTDLKPIFLTNIIIFSNIFFEYFSIETIYFRLRLGIINV